MDERRRKERRLLTYFSRVVDRTNDHLLGYLVDMTTDGALIIGILPLKINDTFSLRIDLPDTYRDQKQLDLEAKAVWCSPDDDPDLYRTGLQILHVNPNDKELLERLIRDYGLTR